MVPTTALPRHLLLALIAALAAACDDGGAPDGDAGADAGADTDSESDTGNDAPCVIRVDGAAGDDGADGTSWATAVATVQTGIDLASPDGCSVWVAAGEYLPTAGDDRSAAIRLAAGVALYGGFAGDEASLDARSPTDNPTVLSGDIGAPDDASDNSYHVVIGADDALIDGFVISAGNADGEAPDSNGGGLLNLEVSPTVRLCTFVDNHAAAEGGAMYNAGGAPRISDCAFEANGATSFGGALANYEASPVIERSAFSDNVSDNGGAINNYSGSSPVVHGCWFDANSASNIGGAIYNETGSSPGVISCLFTANETTYNGAALYNYDGSAPSLASCTVTGNSAGAAGGALYNFEATATIVNSVLWDDAPAELAGDAPTAWYSNLDDATYDGIDGNSSLDPLLDVAFGLLPGSPCLDAADDRVAPPADRVGNGRTDDPDAANCASDGDPECDWFADRGAHERGGAAATGDPLCGAAHDWSNDHRYWACPAPIGWSAAAAYCGALGGYLASATTAAENDFVAGLLDSPLWLGASDADGEWAWAADEPWDFDAWGDGQPSGADGADCLTLDPVDASWSDSPCGAARPFVCERDE
jgi:hypothetical protein